MTDRGSAQGPKCSLGAALYTQMKQFRNRIAQYEDETDCVDTYGALLARCVRAAMKLQELGIGEDDIVSTCSHNHRNSCVPFLASTFIGAIPASFDPDLPQIDTISLLRLMEPKIIFVTQEALKDFEICMVKAQVKPAHIVVFGDSKGKYMNFDDFLEQKVNERQFKVYETGNPKKTAAIVFSSGTTGSPKGICLNHFTLLGAYLKKDPTKVEVTCDKVNLLYSTLYWISRVTALTSAILNGEAHVLCRKFDGRQFLEMVEKYKVTITFLPPYYFTELLEERSKNKEVDVSSLRVLITGSCHVVAKQMLDVMEAFANTLVYNIYGQSEVGGAIALLSAPEDYHFQKEKPTTVGKILGHHTWKIVDLETEQPVTGPNQKGELRLKTGNHMNGYYKMDCSGDFDSEGYFRTGDVAYYDEDDCLFIEDRVKNMFKYRGWHILPAILEGVLMEHPAIKEAAVVGTKYSLGSALYTHMKHFRNRIAQYEDETDYVDTYGALLTRCIRTAVKLQELGIGEDDIVSACTHNHRNSCVPFIATTFIGAIPATFDPALSQIDTISLLRLMEPKIIFVSQEALKDFEICIEKAQVKPAHIVVFGDSKGKYISFDDFLKPQIKEKHFKKTAAIMFSSGTTGLPKGICLNHYAMLRQSSQR
ncbi:unnamed protein product [Callosobruchus maculatus]|uniref:AMP-dependent synthetase/ligase domain-containing protein n=1 Tax=Callosobruchus maculatus TaxID=64391 RepID=A0A653BYQ0_CALMS|nr:unnamed protein product [Callosobruchus maculatus]